MVKAHKALSAVQQALKAPKGQMNKFGGYRYRSCEDILEAVKPHLGEAIILLSDEMVVIGDRFYVKATAAFLAEGERIEVTAYAREAHVKKGMDDSQITGAASSYARKYALNGLLLIDDTQDADATNDHGKGSQAQRQAQQKPKLPQDRFEKALEAIKRGEYQAQQLLDTFTLNDNQLGAVQEYLK